MSTGLLDVQRKHPMVGLLPLLVCVLLAFLITAELATLPQDSPVFFLYPAFSISVLVLSFGFWWLLAPWAGWGPILFVGLLLHLLIVPLPQGVYPLTFSFTLPMLWVFFQRGYFFLGDPQWRKHVVERAYFDDQIAALYPWVINLHPAYFLLNKKRQWKPAAVRRSYEQLCCIHQPAPERQQEAWHGIRLYWPPLLFVCLPLFLTVFTIFVELYFGFVPSDQTKQKLWMLVIFGLALGVLWFLFYPWAGWFTILGLPIVACWSSLYPGGGGYVELAIACCLVLLLQKGYFRAWSAKWKGLMRTHVLVDTRLAEYRTVLNRIHPVILGATYLPRLLSFSRLPARVVRGMWWFVIFAFVAYSFLFVH